MKTTIELSDEPFHFAKKLASKSQTTTSALAEDGLHRVLNDTQDKKQPDFQLIDASIRGGEMLISNPRKWRQLEDEHLAANLC
jgi:predicted transcriptional regulator